MAKLQFLCDNKIGQISSSNRGVYADSKYPSQRQFANEWREIMISLGITVDDEESSPIIDQETISISDEENKNKEIEGSKDGETVNEP